MSQHTSIVTKPKLSFDPARVATPAYVVDLSLLKKNLDLLARVQAEAGCKVLLALKGFAMFSTFPLVRQYLSGCCASGLNEALLAHGEFGKEVHVYSPALKDEEMQRIIPIADHVSFNSMRQWQHHRPALDAARKIGRSPSPGLRINPEVSTVEVALYDPCSPGCRLGVRAVELEDADLSGLEGLHFHALCEQGSDVLEKVLNAVEQNFARFLAQVKWVNMGGGHHITKPGYDVERLVLLVKNFRERHGVDVYLEPGEAIGLNTGYLVTSVLDMVGGTNEIALEGRARMATVQPDEQNRAHITGSSSLADSRRAAKALIRCLEIDARVQGCANAAERIHTEAESLQRWAREQGRLIGREELSTLIGGSSQIEGGSEHDVFSVADGRVLKMTRPPNFGARGDAVNYLTNVLACDSLLGMDWRFEGIVETSDGVRIISSQAFIVGEEADESLIEAQLTMLGFEKKREHTWSRYDGLMLADARPANILRDAAGLLHFIDVHVLGVSMEDLELDDGDACNDSSPVPTAILDTSATCHMPDVLEMPYRPHIIGSGRAGELAHTYKLGGTSCLAGDMIGEYSFAQPLEIGQKLVFTDMAHYTMVKTSTFNGVPHPDIDTYDPETDELRVVRRFGYEDFRNKLS